MSGTHRAQNAVVNSFEPGDVSISVTFVRNTTAMGYLVICIDPRSVIFCVVERSQSAETNTTLSGLPASRYITVIFDVEEDGLPAENAASMEEVTVGVSEASK